MADEAVTVSTWRWDERRAATALALAQGKTWRVIEAELNVPGTTLARWMKAPEFKARITAEVDAIVDDARVMLRRNAGRAASMMVNLVDFGQPQHAVKLAAAKDVLDRVGLKAPEKIDHSGGMQIRVVYDDLDAD